LTKPESLTYKDFMAKYIVKAVKYKNQYRITLPVLLIKEMEWENVLVFKIEKRSKNTATVKPLYRERQKD